jgi:hypothetical protein
MSIVYNKHAIVGVECQHQLADAELFVSLSRSLHVGGVPTGAPALAGWLVRCDVFRRDPAQARDRYSIGAGGDTPFQHLAGAPGCAGDDRRGNGDCATLRLGVGPTRGIASIRRQADRSGNDPRGNFGSVLDCAGRSLHSRSPRVSREPY